MLSENDFWHPGLPPEKDRWPVSVIDKGLRVDPSFKLTFGRSSFLCSPKMKANDRRQHQNPCSNNYAFYLKRPLEVNRLISVT